jgi:hypothetical protein
MPEPDPTLIAELPDAAAAASLRLRDELLAIVGVDLVGMWVHGGTTFADRPGRPGDLDICAVLANVVPDERSPSAWRADPDSRPSRIYTAQESIARELSVIFDTTYLLVEEVGRSRIPSSAFERSHRETDWAVARAHWLAGQYVPLYGQSPEGLVIAPTNAELRRALDRELEHLERHVLEGDANDPFEATYAFFNGCRILRTLETGSPVISKRSAGAWGLENLPPRWHSAIEAAGRAYDGTATAEDNETLRVTMAPFVEMVRQRMPPRRRRAGAPRWS